MNKINKKLDNLVDKLWDIPLVGRIAISAPIAFTPIVGELFGYKIQRSKERNDDSEPASKSDLIKNTASFAFWKYLAITSATMVYLSYS